MAIAIQPKYPIPNRTDQKIRLMKGEDDTVDIGWCDGVLSDGRAFRAELWAQDQITVLTVFFSKTGLENLDELAMKRMMEEEKLVSFKNEGTRYCKAAPFTDPAGNELWSVNVVVGDDEECFINGSIPTFPYSRTGEPNTLFNSTPIKTGQQSTADN